MSQVFSEAGLRALFFALVPVIAVAAPGDARLADLEARISAVEQDIDDVVKVQETRGKKSREDRVDLGLQHRTIVNNIRTEGTDPVDGSITNQWSHRLRLETRARFEDKLRFTGRLAVYKHFGESYEGPVGFDSVSTRVPRDTALRLESAYLDWFVADWLTLSVGRVATPEGPPAELRENTVRSATWGVQMVEGAFESVLLTFDIGDYVPKTYFRLFYSPFFSHSPFNPGNADSVFMDSGLKQMNILGFLAESKLPGLGDNLWQLGFVHVPKFRIGLPPQKNPQTGANVFPWQPDNLGSYSMFNSLLQLRKIRGLDLDAFAAVAVTFYDPNDDAVLYDFGGPQPFGIGMATQGEEGHTATMFYAGFRAGIPITKGWQPRIGAEYNIGSRFHSSWGSVSDLLLDKLSTRGHAVEGYAILPIITDHLFMRVGYLGIFRDHTGMPFLGPTVETEQRVDNIYALLDSSF